MASSEQEQEPNQEQEPLPEVFESEEPPPRPTTPPVRRGFLMVLLILILAATMVYGIPFIAGRAGYAWEAGRSLAATEALAKLGKDGVIDRAGSLFRIATVAVSPAVVNIKSEKLGNQARGGDGSPLANGPRFDQGSSESVNFGSGVIIDRDRGLIVTNNHVVTGGDKITVRLSHGQEIVGKVIGADPKTDLAVVQIKGEIKVSAEWGDSDKLAIGDWVLAIGSPFLLDHTVTAGIVSATGRNNLALPGLDETAYQDFIQTDAAINPGNSGGPLIDLNGKIIGINTAILTSGAFTRGNEGTSLSGGFEGIGLAIPSSLAKKIVEDLITKGKVVRGFLGVIINPVSPGMVVSYKLPNDRGAVVTSVKPGGPADLAGLRVGDVIVGFEGKEITNPATLRIKTAAVSPGSSVALDYYRQGDRQSARVTVAELDAELDPTLNIYGFRLRDLPRGTDGNPLGYLMIDQVVKGSPAFRAGLKVDQRILAVGRIEVNNRLEFERAAMEFGLEQGLPLRVQSPDGNAGMVIVGGPERGSDRPNRGAR